MRQYNKNWLALRNSYISGKRGVVLEGGSRSQKTWSCIDFLIYLFARKVKKVTVNIVKETFASFKTTLYDDFNRRLPDYNIQSVFQEAKEIRTFWIFGNKINLIGTDKVSKFEGLGSDFVWLNEPIPISQYFFDQLEMRCRYFWFMDFNPSVTQHWIFDKLEKREDVIFCHSTMLDNPYVNKWEKQKIQSYEPTHENIQRGTADDYMWSVYGLGLRASPQGLIFKNINWIDQFPEDVDRIWFGLDFGFTNEPTALVKVAVRGNDLYAQELLYTPIESSAVLTEVIKPHVQQSIIWADSADRYIGNQGSEGMVKELQKAGIRIFKAKKFAGSVQFGIDVMKRYRLNIVKSSNFKKEAENYKWREIQGITINEPIGDFDHLWSALRYGCQMELAKRKGFTI